MATHRYWRLKVSANGGGAYVAINEIELRANADGSGSNLSITGNGTASAQSEYSASYVAAYAFDANSANRWNSQNAAGLPQWIKWDFGSGNAQDINHLTIKNTSQEPTNCHVLTANLEYSDDDAAWTAWIPVISHPSTASASATYTRSLYTIAVSMPTPTVSMLGGDRAAATMPTPTLDIRSGLEAPVSMPTPTIVARGGNRADVSMPMPVIDFTIAPGVQNDYSFTLPMPTVEARGGGRVSAALPMPSVAISGTTTIVMRVEVDMPMPSVAMEATKTESVRVTATMPMPTAAARAGGRVAAAMPMPSVAASATSGSVVSVSVDMPMPSVSVTMTAQAYMAIEAAMPMLVAGPYGRITAMMPMPSVSASMQLVVAVTYEAYAVNLMPGQGMPHQVTEYTNFPFNQIVRWGDDYYGVADDGLYLLGGDTDYDSPTPTPIPWRVRSALTNFGSRQMTVVRETVLHGRIGDTVTAKVRVGEGTDKTYAALITRGSTARASRIKYGKGLKAEFWGFELADSLGSTLQLDGWQHDPQPTSRKV